MPAIVIDSTKEMPVAKRDLSVGVPLDLSEAQRKEVVLTKYISTDPMHADWQPDGEWVEVVTADVSGKGRSDRIQLEMDGEKRKLRDDDGYIVRLVGTLTQIVGMVPGQPPMEERQVEEYMDATGNQVPRYQQWDFHVESVLKTNGPEAKAALLKSEDQKRQQAQAEMYQSQTEVFQNIMAMFQAGMSQLMQQGVTAPSAEQVVAAGQKVLIGGKK